VRAVLRALLVVALAGCLGAVQRFPDDVQAAVAHDAMRRLETEQMIVYYPAARRPEVERFLARADRCARALRTAAVIKRGPAADKMVIVMPETAFNNAFVAPESFGYEAVSVIPTMATLDFATEFGLPPDPGYIACHELTHYVHMEQIGGLWRWLDETFGHLYTPHDFDDPWFLEGLATHYEAALSPGVGRPGWPIFTGMFAAAYAGERIGSGELSELGRTAPVGQHYLVGTMFVRFLTERYGEPAAWAAIADQGAALTGWFFAGTFRQGFGASLGQLWDEFNAWHQRVFPARARPAAQRVVGALGNDARYARGRDGTEAWVAQDLDVPPRLTVRAPDGTTLADVRLLDMVPPRTLVDADALLVSGLSVTASGEVWLTAIDRATTAHVPRLLRWRRDDGLRELADDLGPGATIDPAGATYYYCAVDGDRWSLAAYDVKTGARRTVLDMAPGTYALGAQISPDGARLIANVWDGAAFVAWIVDARTGAKLSELRGAGTPIWDASFTDDGRPMWLGVVDARFQVFVDGQPVSDAPYAVLAARSARGTIRFLNREGWRWTLDEIAAPAVAPVEVAPVPPPPVIAAAAAPRVESDEAYHAWDHLFFPQIRSPTFVLLSSGTPIFGLTLGGGDRLGLQRWSISGSVQPKGGASDRAHYGGDVSYVNNMLAPFTITATASALDWVVPISQDTADGKTMDLPEERKTRDLALSVSRTWRDTLRTTLAGLYTRDRDDYPGDPRLDRKLAGPQLELDWITGESTAYAGLRRALYGSVSAAYYPHALSTFAGDLYDTRGELGVVVPLPFGRRHTLTARIRGRAIVADDDTGLLQLGGFDSSSILAQGRSTSSDPPEFDDRRFPPALRFAEYLWGYEDYAITTDRAAIASLWWRYPIILDFGWSSTLGFLPATFVRQLDVSAFATGAIDRRGDHHAAAGVELELSLALMRVPLTLRYQVAKRVRDDDALTQLLALAFNL
jgi:hypothetical protein